MEAGANIADVIIHGKLDYFSMSNDIVLHVLEKPLVFTDKIEASPLQKQNVQIETGTQVQLSDWGIMKVDQIVIDLTLTLIDSLKDVLKKSCEIYASAVEAGAPLTSMVN